MFKKQMLATITILLLCLSAYSQTEPKVIVFKPDSEDSDDNRMPELNSIKLGLIEAIYGSYSVYYERAIHKHFTLDVGLGATFSNTIMTLEPRFEFRPIGISSEYFTYNYGRSFSFGGKYYLSESFDEYYFAFSYFSRSYIWEHFPNGDKGKTLTYNENFKMSAPQILFGYSWLGDAGLVLDTYAGIGFTKFSADLYSTDSDKIESYTETLPTFRFGMKLGIVF